MTRRCPSLIIPQTTKKKKKRPTQTGLAKCANEQRGKKVASDVQSLDFIHPHLTYLSTPSSTKQREVLGSTEGNSPRKSYHSQVGEHRPQASRGATADFPVEKLRFGQAAPLESPCTKETATKTKGERESSRGKETLFSLLPSAFQAFNSLG